MSCVCTSALWFGKITINYKTRLQSVPAGERNECVKRTRKGIQRGIPISTYTPNASTMSSYAVELQYENHHVTKSVHKKDINNVVYIKNYRFSRNGIW